MPTAKPTPELQKIIDARHHDPFAVLGKHIEKNHEVVRAFLPKVKQVTIQPGNLNMHRIPNTDMFEWRGAVGTVAARYQFRLVDDNAQSHLIYDTYSFLPHVTDFDLHLFGEGKHYNAYNFLGAHVSTIDGISGVTFAVWAPNAERVSVVGEFNEWDGRRHQMRVRGSSGVWELFIPELMPNTLYKYEVRNRATGNIFLKSDPYGFGFELRPNTSSYVVAPSQHQWQDDEWLKFRNAFDWQHAPLSIYEVHLASWQHLDSEGEFVGYRELAHRLVDYVKNLGFTHIELLPISEYPLDASWGYQVCGYFAPTSRFGSPDDFRYFVDYCHQQGIGVFLDWVPGHFPKDAHGLAWFDGTALYEYADPRQGEHRDWGTLIFNYGRFEVKEFLISNALFWMREFHIDGLRVDAVASMLYLDYSRKEGEWIPNKYGSNENLEAIDFMRELNSITHAEFPGTLMMAEESTSWPQVTRPTWVGGLGFSMKWNMGWMHDSLQYMGKDPVYRPYYHDHLTFGMLYAFSENFILPFSHDEVVHGKKSLLDRMPGDAWQKFANLRLLYTYQWTYPGKKLLFMGSEFGQGREWDHADGLEWHLLDVDYHAGVQVLIRDLNRLYMNSPELYHWEFDGRGFAWIDCHDAAQSIISYVRRTEKSEFVVVLNFTPVPRHGYRIGVPKSGVYHEVFNSDSGYYGGGNVGNYEVQTEAVSWMNQPHSTVLTLPPLAGIILQHLPDKRLVQPIEIAEVPPSEDTTE